MDQSNSKYASTPEEFLNIPAGGVTEGRLSDAVHCALARADATLLLLHSHFEVRENRLSDAAILDALWAIRGYLDQIAIMTKQMEAKEPNCG